MRRLFRAILTLLLRHNLTIINEEADDGDRRRVGRNRSLRSEAEAVGSSDWSVRSQETIGMALAWVARRSWQSRINRLRPPRAQRRRGSTPLTLPRSNMVRLFSPCS